MEEHSPLFDVCIVCALPEEASAVIDEFSTRCHVAFVHGWSRSNRYKYRWATISNHREEPLTVVVLSLPKPGPIQAATDLKPLLQEFRPRFVAMTGICAGSPEHVRLGDLVVAETAYHYEEGKMVRGPAGQAELQRTLTVDHMTDLVLQYARDFTAWQQAVTELKQRLLAEPEPPGRHIAAMASGMAVRADAPFAWLREQYQRNTVALDMEAASFYHTLRAFPAMHALVVKGVCDYADSRKNDAYHDYAARASAVYLLQFLREYVTQETMPQRAVSEPAERIQVWNIPYPRNPFFLGRETELALLHQRLQAGQEKALSQPQAISGLGGIGKTQIAIEYSYLRQQDYQAVLWTLADTRESLAAGYVAIAALLELPEKDAQDQRISIQAVKNWLQTHEAWLLILDNADDLALASEFLPPTPGGHLLLTTRAQATGAWVQRVEVETMLPEVGVLFLLRRAKLLSPDAPLKEASATDEALAREICEELGGFPLALDQAGAYIEETDCGLVDYLAQLRQKRIAFLQRRGTTSREHPVSLASTWSLSFEKIEQLDRIAADVLRFCAFLAPDAIPQECITADGASYVSQPDSSPMTFSSHFDEAIAILRRFSLVRRNASEKTLAIHRLVQVVLKAQMDRPSQRLWAERVVQVVSRVFPAPDEPAWSHGQRYVPHVHVCMAHLDEYALTTLEAPPLFSRTGRWLHQHGQYKEAETFYLCACRLQEQQGEAGYRALAKTFDSLARLYLDQGMYRQATAFGQRALALKQGLSGAHHAELASTLYMLGRLAHAQVEYLQAEAFYQEALSLNIGEFGSDSPETATTLHALAWLYHDQKFYSWAEDLYQQALSIRLQRLGENHASTAVTLHQLAWLSHQQKRYARAESLYQQALTMKEQTLGLKHPFTAITLHYFARFYHDQQRYTQAEALYQRALTIREHMLGPDHLFTAETLHYLARLSHDQQRYTQAETLYQRALAIREQTLGPEHFMTAMTLHHFARLCEALGQDAQADHFYQRALGIREQVPGRTHPATIAIVQEYVRLLRRLRQEGKATRLEEAYRTIQYMEAENHP